MNVLSWQNETTLSPYPFFTSFGYDNFITDANFIQFDNFIPILNKIEIYDMYINIEMLFDSGIQTITVAKSNFMGLPYTKIIKVDGRYFGKLIFGPDAAAICNELNNTVLLPAVKVLSFLVKSIPSNSGVYSLEKMYGNLTFSTTADIFFNIAGQNVTFNAVALPNTVNNTYLKTINGVAPTDNNIVINDSLIIKVSSTGASVVQFSLLGTGVDNLVAEQNPTIPVNHNP
jgi:hypothetical protein